MEGNSFEGRKALKEPSQTKMPRNMLKGPRPSIFFRFTIIHYAYSDITEPFQLTYIVSIAEVTTYCVLCMVNAKMKKNLQKRRTS